MTEAFGGPQLLIKVPSGLKPLALGRALAAGGAALDMRPLFPVTKPRRAGLVADAEWQIASLGADLPAGQMWDLAHEAKRAAASLGAAPESVFAEPDLIQSWPYTNKVTALGAAPGELCAFNAQDGRFPRGQTFAWHLGAAYSQLAPANASAKASGSVRIGILDTGIDLSHATLPVGFNKRLARNFLADQKPDDVRDPFDRGLLNNPGHGTGTLGVLAGNTYQTSNGGGFNGFVGGAPWADIVPVRIATSVILFRTSTFAQGLDYLIAPNGNPRDAADVVSMSMGGLASQAWADVVNRAYEAGLTVVTAAGNNYPLTPSMVVYPALFRRVLAACGVMADGRPYTREHVPWNAMAGNFGPPAKMDTALAAYTPNTPWAEVNCAQIVDMDGAGTSSATPQIAAAAALYIREHRVELAARQPWERVEIVRHALFRAAKAPADPSYKEALGRGILQAEKALSIPVPAKVTKTPADTASFALFRALFGVGVAPAAFAQVSMYELELTQVVQADVELSTRFTEPGVTGAPMSDESKRALIDTVVSHTNASETLKKALKEAYPSQYVVAGSPLPDPSTLSAGTSSPIQRRPAPPTRRQLRGYAFDPQVSSEMATVDVAYTQYSVRWESGLQPGPVGEYLEVVDFDADAGGFYEPVDLDDPSALANAGVDPSEGNPQFHQQMVYAVIMRTIETFERALGRRVNWSPRLKGSDDSTFVQRLRVYPHAFRQRNAYYDPSRKALLFGYFTADDSQPGLIYPGGMVFTCLSHDVVAHETTHAILDGMQRGFLIPSNEDVLAFHEAFADVVALLQHFTLPSVVASQLARARGDLRNRSLLGALAVQFGQAAGHRGALRNAIGELDPATGAWKPLVADTTALDRLTEPHDRGAILVAAVFDAFLTIYERRTQDLLRIATQGTGVLPEGSLHPDLVERLANEAAKIAGQVLRMCVRAIDYCPPVDITFGDYLRALITADADFMPEDPHRYRVALADAFRRRGIYPKGLRSVAADTLVWDSPDPRVVDLLREPIDQMSPLLGELVRIDPESGGARAEIFRKLRFWRAKCHSILDHLLNHAPLDKRELLSNALGICLDNGYAHCEVRNLQVSQRSSINGFAEPLIFLAIVQRRALPALATGEEEFTFHGGSTLVINPRLRMLNYVVRKRVTSAERQGKERAFRQALSESPFGTYFRLSSDTNQSRVLALMHSDE